MTTHRVTAKTKPPYLARINSTGGTNPEPILIWIEKLEDNYGMPPFARAKIVSSPVSKYPDMMPGATVIVNNFKGLSRIEFHGVPKADRKATPA